MYCIRSLSSSLFLRLLVTKVEHDHLGLPVRMGRLGFTDPVVTSSSEYKASVKVTNPLVRRIVEQGRQPPDASEIRTLQLRNKNKKTTV